MHMAFLSPAWPPGASPNGIVTYVGQMRGALLAAGHRVTVIAGGTAYPDGGEPVDFAPHPGPVGRLSRRLLMKLRGGNGMRQIGADIAAAAAAAHRRFGFDLVEMEETFGWSLAVQRRLDVPVVTRLHGPHFVGQVDPEAPAEARRSAARCADEATAIRHATALTSPSARLLTATLHHVGAHGARARTIPNPVAIPDAPPWSAGACEPGLILCVGRFDRRKGADIVLKAFAEARRTMPGLRLVMAGPDTGIRMPDGELLHFAAYADRFLSPEVRAAIEFRGTLPPAEVAALRRRACLTLVGSRFETFSYAMAEAMALGCPAIGTDIFGVGEIVIDGETGWLVESEDWQGMAAAIVHAVAMPEEAAAMGAASRRRCAEVYGADIIAAESVAFYREVIGS